jgi:RNA polymerase sigma-70 factor (ECF subfamily)
MHMVKGPIGRRAVLPPPFVDPRAPAPPKSYSRLVAQSVSPPPTDASPRVTRETPETPENGEAAGLPESSSAPSETPSPSPSPSIAVAPRETAGPDAKIDAKIDESPLLSKAAAGDTAAFRTLYARHRPDVARLVFRMLGARSDLDDVVQEVFFQVFRSLKDFRGQSKFSTWLHRVTVNVVLMHRRAARSRPVFAEEPSNDITADQELVAPDDDADRRERMRAFGRLLDRLADKKRTVFILHELEGVPPTEIATIVGAPVLTVRTRLFYARRELEAMLADEPSLASLKASLGKASEGGDES